MTRAKTPYSFKTGLLNGLAADFSGQGPTYRPWSFAYDALFVRRIAMTPLCMTDHGLGQVTGFLINVGLIAGAVAATVYVAEWLGCLVAALIFVNMFGANYIANRLP